MSALNYHNPEPPPKPEEESFAADERKFLSNLLDELAKEDRAAHDALLKANPGLLEYDRESENTRERIRGVGRSSGNSPFAGTRAANRTH